MQLLIARTEGVGKLSENFVSDNQDSSRTQLRHLLVIERLLAHRVDVILNDVKRNAPKSGSAHAVAHCAYRRSGEGSELCTDVYCKTHEVDARQH